MNSYKLWLIPIFISLFAFLLTVIHKDYLLSLVIVLNLFILFANMNLDYKTSKRNIKINELLEKTNAKSQQSNA